MRRALALALPCALLLGAPVVARADNPVPPVVTTGAAGDLTQTSATLTATVDPRGSATTYHLEYGTSDSYGLSTAEKGVGSGTGPANVTAAVSGLTSATTYHYRVVATNAAGVARGGDRTFATSSPPRAPSVSTGGTRGTQPTSTTLTGSLDPRGATATFHFEYGTSTRYGAATPDQSAGGSGGRTVTAALAGLTPNTKYHYRLVATNPTGTTRGGDRSVTTLRAPTGISLDAATPNPALWSGSVTLTGRVSGAGVGGAPLAVERQDFPFTGPVWVPKTFSAAGDGSFRVTIGPLWSTARLRVVSRTTIKVASPTVDVANRVRIGVRRAGGTRARAGLTGVISPAVPQAVVSVQRLTRLGRWISLRRTGVQPASGNRSRYAITVRRPRGASSLRVVVIPNDAGAHVRGVSRGLTVRGRG
ncbi:MAG TPA: fibronectin type III domain-containing protein [Solirubrobacteraceae bacterium]